MPPTPPGGEDAAGEPITTWVAAARDGDAAAAERLYRAVYDELRRIAHAQRRRASAGETLSTTVVVHELFLRFAGAQRLAVADRHHFFSLAARVMRQILIDGARRALARGGDWQRLADGAEGLVAPERPAELLALDEALDRLAAQDAGLAELVELHFYAGLPLERIAETAGRSERTLRREWRRARAFLYAQLSPPA